MTERLELYRCDICGNLVQVILSGEGELVCCGEPMKLVKGKHQEEMITEKHVPVFRINDDGNNIVQVGSVLHPMNDEHYIMFIETILKAKPQSLKGTYLKKISISSTMGVGVRVDASAL